MGATLVGAALAATVGRVVGAASAANDRLIRTHLSFDASQAQVLGSLQIKASLQIHPRIGRCVEKPGQAQSYVCRDGGLAVDDARQVAFVDAGILRQCVRRDTEWIEKLSLQYFAGMYGCWLWHKNSLVIIDDLDLICITGTKNEANTILIIDSYAPLTGAISR